MARMSSVAVLQTRMVNELTGCPELLRVEALRDALRQFCEESNAWHETLSDIDIEDGVVEYNLIPEYDAHIQRIVAVRLNTEDGVTDDVWPDPLDESLYSMTPGDPEVLVLDDSLEPADDITGALRVKASFVPEFNSLDIAEWFLNRYWEGIVARAMGIRMRDPNKRWTNAMRAEFYERDYRDRLQRAKAEVSRQFKEAAFTMPM